MGFVFKGLTDILVGKKRLVVEAESLGEIVQIRMLNDERPVAVVFPKVEIRYCDLDPPIGLVVEFKMPVHSYGAHVFCAL